jgi:hypothetical protein
VNIGWQLDSDPGISPLISAKDQRGVPFDQAEKFD